MVIGQQKGRTTREKLKHNFGSPHPEGYRKALRLMKMAEKFGLPIVTFVDTQGAYPGVGSEERHVSEAIAVNLREMSLMETQIISTVIGEGGARLSTGERQLISFARALIANPQIFIMDEATSSIDTETEKKIQDGLQKVFHGRISFVIAHRLSTIRSADQILVINKGKIEERGTHEQLLAQRGHYYELYVNQFRREGEAQALELG